jgi:hypothetical protein
MMSISKVHGAGGAPLVAPVLCIAVAANEGLRSTRLPERFVAYAIDIATEHLQTAPAQTDGDERIDGRDDVAMISIGLKLRGRRGRERSAISRGVMPCGNLPKDNAESCERGTDQEKSQKQL